MEGAEVNLNYIITHVFCPLRLPDRDDHTYSNDRDLIKAVAGATDAYVQVAAITGESPWHAIKRMLQKVFKTVQSAKFNHGDVTAQLSRMCVGDVLTFFVRAQNAGVMFTKKKDITLYAAFEASPQASSVITTRGKLRCSYPGPAIEIPNAVFSDMMFCSELANFLVCMNENDLDNGNIMTERGETVDPRYITQMLTGILRGVGRPDTTVIRVTKHIGDDVITDGESKPWRRSPLWLVVRVAIQTTLESSPQGREAYKYFMIFFLATLTEDAIRAGLSSDVLYFMSTKISRRLRKLGPHAPGWLMKAVLATCSCVREVLDGRWEEVQAVQHTSPPHDFSELKLGRDTHLSLTCSREYLANCLRNQDALATAAPFHPEHHPRGTLDNFLSLDGAFFAEVLLVEPYVTLYDVEMAVEQGIDAWIDGVTDIGEACVKLEVLANKYSTAAQKFYANNPEQLSIMLLTMIELWVALDRLVIEDIPCMEEYSPEIPADIMESILLRRSASLARLRQALQYLSRRNSRAKSKSSVFSPEVSEETFSVRYYNHSERLQAHKRKVEDAAQREVEEKIKELNKANKKYGKLKAQLDALPHTYVTVNDIRQHSTSCRKCTRERALNRQTINAYQWPLPEDELRSAIIVFELACPLSFNMWRSATFHLLVNLCSKRPRSKRPCLLSKFPGLERHFVDHPRSRITLAASSKPKAPQVHIPATEDQICRTTTVTFVGFDTHAGILVENAFGEVNVTPFCTHSLQTGLYMNLQQYVEGTVHSSNEVLANQYDCDKDLSIHEFMAFGHLRSGGTLQWLNVLRELRDRSLTFRSSDVHFLLAQAAMQAGPLSGARLRWHDELHRDCFGRALVDELESLAADVEGNWLEGVTMNTISLLLGRLLASDPSQDVSRRAIKVLRAVRKKTFSWVSELSEKLTRTPGDDELRGLLRDTAAICRSTFDANPPKQLLNCAQDVEILLSCAILIHDNTPTKVSSLPIYSQLLLDRDRRLSLALESILNDAIQDDEGDRGIDSAVDRVWQGYRPGSEWTPLPQPNSRWLSCATAPMTSQRSQVAQFNLLDGSLLVDGKPLGRLPNAIVQHPLYVHIFGEHVVDVIPGDLPGMDYSTRGTTSGHQVYFSLRNGNLVIRAKRTVPNADRSEIFQLIPREKLENDLPAVLVQDHVHWLNLNTSIMEIRASDKPWESSSENWIVECIPGQYRMRKGDDLLVDIRSQSWIMVSNLLVPLESPQNLIITVSPIEHQPSQLRVVLPRYGLSFFVNDAGNLQSRDIRDMVYDENQSIGALFGLVNQLVLRPKVRDDVDTGELIPRCVLIPEGDVTFRVDGHHVCVEIITGVPTLQRVTYQMYRVDPYLGCLTGNVSLTNKLFRAYLHALTSSGCSDDPLTGRSGTEEALGLLRSASSRSVMKFGQRDAELLRLIASLCPKRALRSRYRNMQVISWLDLPVRSQSQHLYLAAKEIMEHVEKLRFFHDSWEADLLKFSSHDEKLFTRSRLRASHLLPSEDSVQPDCSVPYDPPRDLIPSDSPERRVCNAATAIFHWSLDPIAITVPDLVGLVESWTVLLSREIPVSFSYTKSWLNPSLSTIWIAAYNVLRQSTKADDRFKLLFSLPSMAFRSEDFSSLASTFIAFAVHPAFRDESPPPHSEYNLRDGYQPDHSTVQGYVTSSARDFNLSPESYILERPGESLRALWDRQRKSYQTRLNTDADQIAGQVVEAWPTPTGDAFSVDFKSDVYDRSNLNLQIRRLFQSCSQNNQFRDHVTRVQNMLCNLDGGSEPRIKYTFVPRLDARSQRTPLTLDQLVSTRPPPLLPPRNRLPGFTAAEAQSSASGLHRLYSLVTAMQANPMDIFRQQYGSDLQASASHFTDDIRVSRVPAADVAKEPPSSDAVEQLADYLTLCKDSFADGLAHAQKTLSPTTESDQALERSGQWPRITTEALFRFIASTSPPINEGWKRYLVQLALRLLEFQRARRLLRFAVSGQQEDFYKELENGGCDGWDPEAQPDWVLIQLQSDFFIRRVQVDVANEMVSPRSGENTVMQLNMGEGKSSVIVPISVVQLADCNQLVRVIVPKALTTQMFQILVERLGGLTNRQIYYLPFSRSLPLGPDQICALRSLMEDCMQKRGVMVVQPDHALSLKLVTVEKQLCKHKKVAGPLLDLQRWLHSKARDIIDESDEILHVRYKLIYTIGFQQPMEGFPERWTMTQKVLGTIKKYAASFDGVDYQEGPHGSFPHIRILHSDAAEALMSLIADDVINGEIINFQQLGSQPAVSHAIHCFITTKDVPPSTVKVVQEYTRGSTLWGALLLLRGLLATGILLCAFRDQRWRVDYGLAPQRTMLAVPYRAKDVPAPKAEFGHPDVAIVLTCLSYYYGGLTEEQLNVSFELLLKQDDPSLNYDKWVRGSPSVPNSLRSHAGINLKSSEQWKTHLVPLFSRNHATIDFFLERVVFPKEAKVFPSKLACSGWDLVEKKERLLTGFSGTNDGRYLLPLHIAQRDPDHQLGTNAKVLSYLLQPENDHYMCTQRRTTVEFLEILVAQQPEIRVLLDVGAQMLDLQNHKLAEAWLSVCSNASAAIYFNEDDELTVLTRDGSTQLLLSSPFAQQLDQCVVYLDDAHTRGTDIKFPSGFRAAVTLGPKVTKDRLAQGCMRMRKLGSDHSLVFFAPLEIDCRIRTLANKGPSSVVDTKDILHWAICETCNDIQQRAPQWAQQGMDHRARYAAWSRLCANELTAEDVSREWLQPEVKSLEELYAPQDSSNTTKVTVPAIQERCSSLGVTMLREGGMNEEQEREIIHEVEREREVERPVQASPAKHSVSKEVTQFVKTGIIPDRSPVFHPVFTTLKHTSAITKEPRVWSRWVLATEDFCRTIVSEDGAASKTDDFLRPVQWIVSSQTAARQVLVILSPHEVSCLLPSIRSNENVHLHLYTPRTTKSMTPTDNLTLYSIPEVPDAWTPPEALMSQLNIFAGQLYLSDHAAYIRLCRFLCVYAPDLKDECMTIECDGFIKPDHRRGSLANQTQCTFQRTQLPFVKVLLGLRRKGMPFGETHMGKIVDGAAVEDWNGFMKSDMMDEK